MSAPAFVPFSPLPLRLANALGRGAGALGWRGISLAEERLHAGARFAARLEDLGEPRFLVGLRVLLGSLERRRSCPESD